MNQNFCQTCGRPWGTATQIVFDAMAERDRIAANLGVVTALYSRLGDYLLTTYPRQVEMSNGNVVEVAILIMKAQDAVIKELQERNIKTEKVEVLALKGA
jgi:hypothetical protein